MKIGVISDTHDRVENAVYAVTALINESIDVIVHCGDWKNVDTLKAVHETCSAHRLPLYGVLGNNDTDVVAFEAYAARQDTGLEITEGVMHLPAANVVAYHGHHTPTLRTVRADPSVHILLLGHTHKPKIETVDGKLIVNPGSLGFGIPRSREWRPSYAVVDTTAMTAELRYFSPA